MKNFFGTIFIFVIFLFFPNKVLASTPVQNNSSYTTPSAPAASDGTSTETVSIHLQDNEQKNVVGNVITLSSSNDSTAIFPQNDQTTDSNGNATFKIATTTPGSVKITLFDSSSGITFIDWFSLIFYDSAKGCVNIPSAPILVSVVSNVNNKATITWTNVANPVNNYVVSFGLETGKYIYGDPNVGPQGTTSYTAQSLTANKKYYFVVAANNNCGRSGFSNEMSVVVNPVPVTPTPSIKPTPVPTAVPVGTPFISSTSSLSVITDSLVPSEPSSNGTASQSDVSIKYRNVGLIIIALGILIIGGVFIAQGVKNKNSIPKISNDSPQQPFKINS